MRGFAGGLASGLAAGYQLADQAETNKLRREQMGLELANLRETAEDRRLARDAERAVETAGRDAYQSLMPPRVTRDEEGNVMPGMEDADQDANDPIKRGQNYLKAQEARIAAAYKTGRSQVIDRELERGKAIRGLVRKEMADSAFSAFQRGDLEGAAKQFAQLYDMVPDGKRATLSRIAGADTGKPVVEYKIVDEDGNEKTHAFDFSSNGVQKLYYGLTDPARLADLDAKDFDRRYKLKDLEIKDRNANAAERRAAALEEVSGARAGLYNVQAEAGGFRPSSGGGGGGGAGDASKGAKYDVDGEGNRVIVYRDGTMVYPKDAAGNPVKFKVGSDQDQKFIRKIVGDESKKNPVAQKDPVAYARDLAARTGGGGPSLGAASPQSKPVESFRQKFGY